MRVIRDCVPVVHQLDGHTVVNDSQQDSDGDVGEPNEPWGGARATGLFLGVWKERSCVRLGGGAVGYHSLDVILHG
jgi:hypothetical protein